MVVQQPARKDSTPNWILATGQMWKLYVALAGFTGTLGCFTMAVFSLGGQHEQVLGLAGKGVVIGLATFAWLVIFLRCPHCQAKLVWNMAISRPHSSWVIDLAALEVCPVCRRSFYQGGRSTA